MKKTVRHLQHLKSTRVRVGEGHPKPGEGATGDLSLRMTKSGLKLFAKFRDKWYVIGQGSLKQLAGENQDITLDENHRKGTQLVTDKRGIIQAPDRLELRANTGGSFQSSIKILDDIIIKAADTFDLTSLGDINITTLGDINITPSGGQVIISDSGINDPDLILRSTSTAGIGPNIYFQHNTSDPDDGDSPGTIYFQGVNDNEELINWGTILNEAVDVSDSSELGRLTLKVAAVSDCAGLILEGISSARVDAKIGLGSASLTTIAGDLDIDGDTITSAGTLEIDAGGTVSITGAQLNIDAQRKIALDASGGTYIWEASDDKMELVAGGDQMLTLDEGNQRVTIEADKLSYKTVGGTNNEFSVADSAYAGMILGYTTVGIDAADDSYTITTGFVVPDAALKVSFIIPPSGTVEIFVSIFADHGGTRSLLFGLSTADSYAALDVTHEHEVLTSDETDEQQVNHRWVITGLTPGDSETYWLGVKGQQAGSVVLRWGGDISGEYAPFIMKATALPAAVTDYAVYD